MIIHSFPPIANPNAKILLLGTMPSVQSLMLQEYYGNPRNHFWKILFTLCHQAYSTDYATKQNLLLQNRIALWDVLQSCERPGSLDSAIAKEIPNDFDTFLKAHQDLTHIAFNGQQAAKYFKKYVRLDTPYTLLVLPSTSPANAAMSLEQKLGIWQGILI